MIWNHHIRKQNYSYFSILIAWKRFIPIFVSKNSHWLARSEYFDRFILYIICICAIYVLTQCFDRQQTCRWKEMTANVWTNAGCVTLYMYTLCVTVKPRQSIFQSPQTNTLNEYLSSKPIDRPCLYYEHGFLIEIIFLICGNCFEINNYENLAFYRFKFNWMFNFNRKL